MYQSGDKKKGQVTIFIIIALVVVVVIAMFFFLRSDIGPGDIFTGGEVDPGIFLTECIQDYVREGAELIGLQGGYLNEPFNRSFQAEGEETREIAYLCYNQNSYYPCINHKPTLIQDIKKELKNYISEPMDNCLKELENKLNKKYDSVEINNKEFEIGLTDRKIIIDVDTGIILTEKEARSKLEDVRIIIPSRLYDNAIFAQEIVAQEANYCNYDTLGNMVFNRQFNIKKFETGNLDTVYTIEHKESQEKFRFAIRGCTIPPGM